MKEAKRSLIEVIIGIWFLAVIVILAGVFFVPSKIPYVLGEVTGSLVATLMMVHLYHCLDHEMDLNRKSAVNHSRWNGFLRALIEIVVLLGSLYSRVDYAIYCFGWVIRKKIRPISCSGHGTVPTKK